MADQRAQSRPRTEEDGLPAAVIVSVVLGAFGVLAAFIPGLFWVAWLLGAVAIAVSLPVLRRGRAAPSHGLARVAFGAGLLAIVIGVLNLGITADWFTYFTTDDAHAPQ